MALCPQLQPSRRHRWLWRGRSLKAESRWRVDGLSLSQESQGAACWVVTGGMSSPDVASPSLLSPPRWEALRSFQEGKGCG